MFVKYRTHRTYIMGGTMIKVKKEQWRKPRNAYLTFVAIAKPIGNSTMISPALPPEYCGKKILITVIDDEPEECEIIKDNEN